MGASFVTEVMPGTLTGEEVRNRFIELQEQDRYENGHSYSGTIGMASRLRFTSKTFDSLKDAEEWLADNAQKWGPAEAVTCRKKYDNGDEATVWVIGAWCAS